MEAYPYLEAEDIQQALAYGSHAVVSPDSKPSAKSSPVGSGQA